MAASTSTIVNQEQSEKFVPETVLQKHVFFFDRNKDGIIYPWETFQGLRAIGLNMFISVLGGLVINASFGPKTRPGKCFSLLLPIEVKNIKWAIHGSDTGVYDSEGRFVLEKFEEIFKRYSRTQPSALTKDEMMTMVKAIREPKDYLGWFAGYIQWTLVYQIAKNKNGLVQKDSIRGLYDGTLFERIEEERKSTKKNHN